MMNTLHKSLIITFLAVSIHISGLSVDFVGAQNTAASTAATRLPEDQLLSPYLRFGRLTSEDGLLSNHAYHVAQDSYGFMWFATPNGLNRYDGSNVKVYCHDPDKPHSLSNNIVRTVYEDRDWTIWLGSMGGLNKLDRESRQFTRYSRDHDDPNSL